MNVVKLWKKSSSGCHDDNSSCRYFAVGLPDGAISEQRLSMGLFWTVQFGGFWVGGGSG